MECVKENGPIHRLHAKIIDSLITGLWFAGSSRPVLWERARLRDRVSRRLHVVWHRSARFTRTSRGDVVKGRWRRGREKGVYHREERGGFDLTTRRGSKQSQIAGIKADIGQWYKRPADTQLVCVCVCVRERERESHCLCGFSFPSHTHTHTHTQMPI